MPGAASTSRRDEHRGCRPGQAGRLHTEARGGRAPSRLVPKRPYTSAATLGARPLPCVPRGGSASQSGCCQLLGRPSAREAGPDLPMLLADHLGSRVCVGGEGHLGPPHSEAQLGGWHRRPSGSRGPSGSSQRARLYRGTHARSPQPGPENQPPSSRPWATHTRRRDVPEPAHAPRGRRQKTGRSRLPPPAASERD